MAFLDRTARSLFLSELAIGMWVTLRYWWKTYDPQRKTFTEHFEYPELPVPVSGRQPLTAP